jgi:hypothetical protein
VLWTFLWFSNYLCGSWVSFLFSYSSLICKLSVIIPRYKLIVCSIIISCPISKNLACMWSCGESYVPHYHWLYFEPKLQPLVVLGCLVVYNINLKYLRRVGISNVVLDNLVKKEFFYHELKKFVVCMKW